MQKAIAKIKSYVLRQGRMTELQKRALSDYWAEYGLDAGLVHRLDFGVIFDNQNPVILEIGFGMGDSLLEQAQANPQINFIGIEVHRPGVGAFLAKLKRDDLVNVRVFCHDAVEVLSKVISDGSLASVQIFFPDPWHKTRHHKRRIVQVDFVKLISSKLKDGGSLHLATDWQEYAAYMQQVIDLVPELVNVYGPGSFALNTSRPKTKFEQRGLGLGHEIFDLIFNKTS